MTKTSELAHLFRALKAPAAARALPKLADRAREEEWSYERFAEVLLQTEVASRDSHGGENRILAGFPAILWRMFREKRVDSRAILLIRELRPVHCIFRQTQGLRKTSVKCR